MIDNSRGGGPALDSYNTAALRSRRGAMARGAVGDKVSRGYREEMEHFCYCIKNQLGYGQTAMQRPSRHGGRHYGR